VTTKGLRILVTALLLSAAALFAVGVAIERDSKHGEPHAAVGIDYVLAADEHAGARRGTATDGW
jgi:hypothetical protein